MRKIALLLSLAMLLTVLTGCSLSGGGVTDNNAFKPLTTKATGDLVQVRADSAKAVDGVIHAELRYTLAKPDDKGQKYSLWKIQYRPSERLVKMLSITGYDEKGNKIPDASSEEKEEVVKATGYSYWNYVTPEGPLDQELQALTDYCIAQKMTISKELAPYIDPKFQSAGAFSSVLLFFDPASVKIEGDSVIFTARVIYDKENPTGVRYENGTIEVKPLERKFRGLSRSAYNASNTLMTQDKGTDDWAKLTTGTMVDILFNHVHDYAHGQGMIIPE